MDNAAFEDDREGELKKVLDDVTEALVGGCNAGVVRDSNGNTIGKFIIYQDTGKKGEKVKV
jgi:hypothetical protein